MVGTMDIDGVKSKFDSYMFAELEEGTGKMVSLKERVVWGPADGDWEHGVN